MLAVKVLLLSCCYDTACSCLHSAESYKSPHSVAHNSPSWSMPGRAGKGRELCTASSQQRWSRTSLQSWALPSNDPSFFPDPGPWWHQEGEESGQNLCMCLLWHCPNATNNSMVKQCYPLLIAVFNNCKISFSLCWCCNLVSWKHSQKGKKTVLWRHLF